MIAMIFVSAIVIRKSFGYPHRRDVCATGGTGILLVEKTFPDSHTDFGIKMIMALYY